MSTVLEYLNKRRAEDSNLANLSYLGAYNELKSQGDPHLPEWDTGNVASSQKARGQKSYERKADPNFVNSLFDWTDWGINEGSAQWAKSAYNNSITGLAYQYYNGEQI